MRKIKFWTLLGTFDNIIPKLVDGYTDDKYNYYRKGATWYAIAPTMGLSVCSGTTRKAVQQRARAIDSRVAAATTTFAITRYAEAVAKAKGKTNVVY